MDEKVVVLTGPTEIPVSELPPKERLGAIVRRARTHAKMDLFMAVEAINKNVADGDHALSAMTLSHIEGGLRPVSQEQIDAIAAVFGAHLGPLLLDAAQAWNREVWRPAEPSTLEVESVKAKCLPSPFDVVELLSVLRLAKSTLESAQFCMNQFSTRLQKGQMITHSEDRDGIVGMTESVNALIETWTRLVDTVAPE